MAQPIANIRRLLVPARVFEPRGKLVFTLQRGLRTRQGAPAQVRSDIPSLRYSKTAAAPPRTTTFHNHRRRCRPHCRYRWFLLLMIRWMLVRWFCHGIHSRVGGARLFFDDFRLGLISRHIRRTRLRKYDSWAYWAFIRREEICQRHGVALGRWCWCFTVRSCKAHVTIL